MPPDIKQFNKNELDIYKKELKALNDLAHQLRKARFKAGSVNFETVEVKFVLDETGKPLGITPKVRKDAHKLIEEFMLLANKRVAEFVFNKKKDEPRNTMVYRIHEAPDPEKLQVFSSFAKKFGYQVTTDPQHVSKSFNALMENIEGKGEIGLDRLVREALRMRPDRLVVGEVRGAELIVMLQALNTGHRGAAATIHANSLEDVLPRVNAIGRSVGIDSKDMTEQMQSAFSWLIHVDHRTVVKIARIGEQKLS